MGNTVAAKMVETIDGCVFVEWDRMAYMEMNLEWEWEKVE